MTNCWQGGLFLQPRKLNFKMPKVWVSFPYFECYYIINNNISYYWLLRGSATAMKTQDGEGVWVTQVSPNQKCSVLAQQDRARGSQKYLQSAAKHDWAPGALGPTNQKNRYWIKNRYWVLVSWPYPVFLCSLLFGFSEVLTLLCFWSKLKCTMVLYCFAFWRHFLVVLNDLHPHCLERD